MPLLSPPYAVAKGIFSTLFFLLLVWGEALATRVRVGVLEGRAPLSDYQEGKPHGLAVEIWKDLAAKKGWTIDYRNAGPSPLAALKELGEGKYDVLLGPLMPQGATHVDWGGGYFLSYDGLVIHKKTLSFWTKSWRYCPPVVVKIIFFFLLGCLLLPFLIYFLERKKNPLFPSWRVGYSQCLFSFIQMFLRLEIYYNPKRWGSLWIYVVWILTSFAMTALIGAVVAGVLTLGSLNDDLMDPKELKGMRVAYDATKRAPQTRSLLENLYLFRMVPVSSLAEGFQALKSQEVEALLGTQVELEVALDEHRDFKKSLILSTLTLNPAVYSFAFHEGFVHREEVADQVMQWHLDGYLNYLCAKNISKKNGLYCRLCAG